MITWLKIVCAVDLSESSRPAVEQAASLARRFDAKLVVVHVWSEPPGAREAALAPPSLFAKMQADVEEKLDAWKREAERIAGSEVRAVLATGSPASEVARIADAERADLVVVGTHGRKGLPRFVLGSVAEAIVRQSPCTVLVARAVEPWDG